MDLIGFVAGLSNDAYHSGPGVNRSLLWRLLSYSPAHSKVQKEPTDSMQMGADLHCAILEPDRFERQYVVIPADCRVGSGKGQRGRLEDFMAEAERNGQTTIKDEDMEAIRRMADAVRKDPDASEILKGSEFELSGYWYDPDETDILCKIRLDVLQTSTGIIADLKKTTDAREHKFQRHAHDMGYHMQAFMSCYGATHIAKAEHKDFRFIVVEDHDPWAVQVYQATSEFLHIGGLDFGRAFRRYVECLRSNTWPAYDNGLHPLNPPGWRMRQEMMSEIIE